MDAAHHDMPPPPQQDEPQRAVPERSDGLYLRHFGLRDRPFSLIPDPNYLFWSDTHSRAYAMLEYGLASFAPITVITGEIGAGKTTLVRHLLSTCPSSMNIALVANAHANRGQVLQWVLRALGDTSDKPMSYVKRFSLFEDYLRRQAEAGRRTLLVFDEAQNLSAKMLEELRCFSNLNGGSEELLQILLVGQPELLDTLAHPRMLQFAQRVSARHHLSGMPKEMVRPYIAHRLATAGAKSWIFTPGACDLVADACGGLPRVINQICDYALVYAFAEGRSVVPAELVKQVIDERQIHTLIPAKMRS